MLSLQNFDVPSFRPSVQLSDRSTHCSNVTPTPFSELRFILVQSFPSESTQHTFMVILVPVMVIYGPYGNLFGQNA